MSKYFNITDREWQSLMDMARDIAHNCAEATIVEQIEKLKIELLDILRKEIDEELESRMLYELKQIRRLLEDKH